MEVHELQEEKLVLSHVKQKNAIEKTHSRNTKKASKKGNPIDIRVKNEEEMQGLLKDQQTKVLSYFVIPKISFGCVVPCRPPFG